MRTHCKIFIITHNIDKQQTKTNDTMKTHECLKTNHKKHTQLRTGQLKINTPTHARQLNINTLTHKNKYEYETDKHLKPKQKQQ